ncbi:PREDICTED: sulfotransferase 1C1-like, partial [Nestor notabilis]|uniref:sulfotransferase 1C1-like n=1 Tax=Nestor notabilis TaxID=176057 RepID=UPI0005231B71
DKDCKVMPRVLPSSLCLSAREEHRSAPIHFPSAVIYMACNPKDVVVSSSYFFQVPTMLPDPDTLTALQDPRWEVQMTLWSLGKEVVQGVVVRVLHHMSFGDMRKNPAASCEAMPTVLVDHSLSPFLWEGGDWKNHFTVAQNGPSITGST